jgi:hypothetical protein
MRSESIELERMRIALELVDLAEAMFRQRLRRERPARTEAEIDGLVQAWRERRPGAEHGDAEGTPVAWPRRR